MVRRWIAEWIFLNLGGGEKREREYCVPPGSRCELIFGDEGLDIATFDVNDGFELWLGSPNKWYRFYSGKEARQLAWFVLWTWWVKATWFGFKRKLWYWGLSNKVRQRDAEEQRNQRG